ncbi:MAG: sugar transferase [Nocardioides sp.]|uniref:sugar transferase n=1 Tax=Nocardioides sp. TaxID=35761 RepID=UPI0039E2D1FA
MSETVGSVDWHPPEHIADLMTRPVTEPAVSWRKAYVRRRVVVDALVLLFDGLVVLGASQLIPGEVGPVDQIVLYLFITLGLVVSWLTAQRLLSVYDRRFVIEGSEEYHRVARAAVAVIAATSLAATAATFALSRFFLLAFFLIGTLGLLGTRKLARRGLRRRRLAGEGATSSVLVLGGSRSARILAAAFARHGEEGYRIVGVWWPDPKAHYGPWVEILGETLPSYDAHHTLAEAIAGSGADAVIVTDTELLGNAGLKALGWALVGTGIDLLVSPNVIDVAGPRLHVRPVANLPLIHLDEPQYEGASRVEKAVLDRVIAVVGLLVASPVMLVIALLIKLGDGGPVFYRSIRVGVGGAEFGMLKFRTMTTNADELRLEMESEGDGPLFKVRNDPRITRVGGFLRRYSLDELPQLWNVLIGQMSVVGPRPPLPGEVAEWTGGVERRLLVKQGMTGLWQVSGRSDLSWEDSVRLDIDYVENWSITRDLQIIWRTVRAVLGSDGAY